jgi:hypothetical protein
MEIDMRSGKPQLICKSAGDRDIIIGELIKIDDDFLHHKKPINPELYDDLIAPIKDFFPIEFNFTIPITKNNERFFNYLATVPDEWDLFIRQCLEKWPVN